LAGGLTAFLVTSATDPVEDVLGVAGRALQGGISAILVRRPHATAREVYDITRQLRPATRQLGCRLVVSDRVDVALAAEADGVHLAARSIPITATRRLLSKDKLLGYSTHDLDEVTSAEEEGADYVFLGPIFETESHPGTTGLGLDHLREAVLRAAIPVVAIGGVTERNAELVGRTGAAGAAAIRAYSESPDPATIARAVRAALAR
jgi:thiamine-phosphate pyrophosphorylase